MSVRAEKCPNCYQNSFSDNIVPTNSVYKPYYVDGDKCDWCGSVFPLQKAEGTKLSVKLTSADVDKLVERVPKHLQKEARAIYAGKIQYYDPIED